MTERPDWDTYFFNIANQVATRSTRIRRQIGAVIVRDNQILVTGYNGAPRGCTHCATCMRDAHNIPSGTKHEFCLAAHAEQNAICQAARHGVALKDGILYCHTSPCSICAKMLINVGIVQIKYKITYPDSLATALLKEAGLETIPFI